MTICKLKATVNDASMGFRVKLCLVILYMQNNIWNFVMNTKAPGNHVTNL